LCEQAKFCDEAPAEVKAAWPESIHDLLAGLVLPPRPPATT
jgi:hypothetical protein